LNLQPSTQSSDSFQFGLVIWELFTFRHWYRDIGDAERAIKEGVRPSLTGIPIVIADMLRACWLQTPQWRPSAKKIGKHLGKLMDMLELNPTMELPIETGSLT
jgi:hypothetical protein